MALDEKGTKMFLISNTGVTVAPLYQVPLSLATLSPATGASGTTVTLRGCGFQSGATVFFGTVQVSATFVDSNTLRRPFRPFSQDLSASLLRTRTATSTPSMMPTL
ncbi:MAG: hypothetical protein DMG50_02355 [Acidobacteria bacterium]|nr:MAG: hypothetical protein DMG50_02355 [Acidobacteriota bacterium]